MMASLLLAGCSSSLIGGGISEETVHSMPVDETGPWTEHAPTARERAIAASDFSIEVVRFTDARRARSLEAETPDQLIQQYDPESLLQGISYRVPNIMERYLSYKPKMQKNYKIEVELTRLLTLVKTGTTMSGNWGRYSVDMQLRVIARRDDSTVVMQRTYTLQEQQNRTSNLGRGPSKERDRARMYDLTESMLRKISEQIGWDLRQRDARRWRIETPAPAVNTQFGLDQATGNVETRRMRQAIDASTDGGVEWVDPTMPAVIVPARPAEPGPAPEKMWEDTTAPAFNGTAEDTVDEMPGDLPEPAVPLGADTMGPRG